jgi:hypothetical protein
MFSELMDLEVHYLTNHLFVGLKKLILTDLKVPPN